jgi:catechol 2,3-dioxygenase
MTQATTQAGPGALLGEQTRLGGVHLRVRELDRSIPFYTRVVGLQVHERDDDAAVATLGAGGEAIVTLHAQAGARAPGREAGLYHVALLYGSREELARAGRRVGETRTPIDGASDHGTHEAIYLPDPDGIGIELAADRPRSQWPSTEAIFGHGPAPLDVGGLFATIAREPPRELAEPSLRVGHVHLHVGALEPQTRFYRDGLGFAVMAEMEHAVFVSAGGYHHHVAFNLWRGPQVPAAADDALGLIHWTLETADAAELDAVRERLRALGVAITERADSSFMARDGAGIAVAVRAAG